MSGVGRRATIAPEVSTGPTAELPGAGDARAFFSDSPLGVAVFERIAAMVIGVEGVTVRTTKSQVALRRRRGFAYLWRPGQYLRGTEVEVVLSIALTRLEASVRFKQVAHPAPTVWMHHVEIRDLGVLDEEMAGRLLEAADRAG